MYKSRPNEYSFGLQEYSYYKNIRGFEAIWKFNSKVQNIQMHKDEITVESKLFEEYIDNAREQLRRFEKYQMKFDNLLKTDEDKKISVDTKTLLH